MEDMVVRSVRHCPTSSTSLAPCPRQSPRPPPRSTLHSIVCLFELRPPRATPPPFSFPWTYPVLYGDSPLSPPPSRPLPMARPPLPPSLTPPPGSLPTALCARRRWRASGCAGTHCASPSWTRSRRSGVRPSIFPRRPPPPHLVTARWTDGSQGRADGVIRGWL